MNNLDPSRLLSPRQRLPQQFDRAVDSIVTPPAGGGGAAAPGPFQIVDASAAGPPPTAAIGVTFGLLQQPQWGTFIDVTLGGTSLALGPTLSFGSAGTYFIYLDVNLSGTPAAIVSNTAGTVPSDDPTIPETYLLLGIVTVAVSGAGLKVTKIQQAVTGALIVQLCPASSVFFWSAL